jgi:hypothetical protein
LALSAQLRNPEGARTLKLEEQDPTLSSLQYTLAQWQRLLSQDSPPSDWKRWLTDMQAVEKALHGGSSGVANETFYQETRDFLARVDAPGFVHQVVSFRHGLAAWDFHEVNQAGTSLLESIQSREGYLSVSEYVDGVVVAKLMLGESQAARQLYDQLVPAGIHAQAPLGLQLLNAYINAPGRSSPSQLAGPLVLQAQ